MKQRNNPQILILVGAPGSGKSTFARYMLRTEENWMRVCRDDYRSMHFIQGKASDREEMLISKMVDAAIEALLHKKSNVIIDATHTKKDYIEHYIEKFGHLADISFKLFEASYAELQERCDERYRETGKFIPPNVLKKFVDGVENLKSKFDFSPREKTEKRFAIKTYEEEKPNCFLFDLDGTLSDGNGRSMYTPTHEEILADLPITPVVSVLQALSEKYRIVFLSGREDTYHESTSAWIRQHIVHNAEHEIILHMRSQGDFRKDSVIKREILNREILPNYNVVAAFDDRLQVQRECWNAENIFSFNVNQFLLEY